jgi:hypothetical protein
VFKLPLQCFVVTASVALLAACASAPQDYGAGVGIPSYWHSVDKATGAISDGIRGSWDLQTPPFDPAMHAMDFSLERRAGGASSQPLYTLTLDWVGNEALRIGSGQTLTLLLNKEATPIALEGAGSAGKRDVDVDTARWSEAAAYAVTRAQLQSIADAKNVDFQLRGAGRVEKGYLQDDYIRRVGKFLDLFQDQSAAGKALSPTAQPSGAGQK